MGFNKVKIEKNPLIEEKLKDLTLKPKVQVSKHPSSLDRFSENFSDKVETCVIFFVGTH